MVNIGIVNDNAGGIMFLITFHTVLICVYMNQSESLKTYLFQSFCSFMLFCKGSLGFLEGTIKSKLLLLLYLHDLI